MISVPGGFQSIKNALHSTHSWVELWTIDLNGTLGLFITSHTASVTFNGQVYQRAAITREVIDKDTRGSIPSLRVSIGNIDGQAVLLAGQYPLSGRTVTVQLVNTATIGTATAVITERYAFQECEANDLWLVCTLGILSPMDIPFPRRRFQRNRCDNVYGDDLCGYDRTRAGALATCDLTYNQSNGCSVHGDDEVAAGRPRQHTHNFGGCPSLLRGPYQ